MVAAYSEAPSQPAATDGVPLGDPLVSRGNAARRPLDLIRRPVAIIKKF